jgi:quinoprotein glucose dehydrogenase
VQPPKHEERDNTKISRGFRVPFVISWPTISKVGDRLVTVTVLPGVLLAASWAMSAQLAAQPAAASTVRSVKDGVYTAEQAARGRAVYNTHCAECHMADLAGHEYAGALAGYGFQLKWQDAPLADLLGRMRGMPLGRPGSLTAQEYVDILAYALQKNGYPAGTVELTGAVVARWPQIRIERIARTPE